MSTSEPQPIFLSIGSNLGDREMNLRHAIEALQHELRVTAVSWIYETDPVGVTDQPAFLNVAVAGETELTPVDLLCTAKRIERDLGRRPAYRWGPRAIDIDILLYGDVCLETPDLVIPHRELTNRAFVLVPLAEIARSTVHPVTGLTVREHSDRIDDAVTVRRLRPFPISNSA